MEFGDQTWVTISGYLLFLVSEILGYSNCSTNSCGQFLINMGKAIRDKGVGNSNNESRNETNIQVPGVTSI